MVSFFRDFFLFAIQNKKIWLLPFMLVLLTFGALLFFTQGSVVAPFVYTLF